MTTSENSPNPGSSSNETGQPQTGAPGPPAPEEESANAGRQADGGPETAESSASAEPPEPPEAAGSPESPESVRLRRELAEQGVSRDVNFVVRRKRAPRFGRIIGGGIVLGALLGLFSAWFTGATEAGTVIYFILLGVFLFALMSGALAVMLDMWARRGGSRSRHR